jgi:hypothetical protein
MLGKSRASLQAGDDADHTNPSLHAALISATRRRKTSRRRQFEYTKRAEEYIANCFFTPLLFTAIFLLREI